MPGSVRSPVSAAIERVGKCLGPDTGEGSTSCRSNDRRRLVAATVRTFGIEGARAFHQTCGLTACLTETGSCWELQIKLCPQDGEQLLSRFDRLRLGATVAVA